MKTTILFALAVIMSFCCFRYAAAQALNNVRIGNCTNTAQINTWIDDEVKAGLVMDARPFAINQSQGKLLFTRGAGRVSVIHMNPFVYNYRISVAQQELVSTALTDFLKLILPGSLGQLPSLQSGKAGERVQATASNKLAELETRLSTLTAGCTAPAGAGPEVCNAVLEMFRVFNLIKPRLGTGAFLPTTLDNSRIYDRTTGALIGPTNERYIMYAEAFSTLRNEQFEAYTTCHNAEQLNTTLDPYDFDRYFNGLNDAQAEISALTSLADDLKQLGEDYNKDTQLKDKIVRCSGFNCTNQFLQYAEAVKALVGTTGYQLKLQRLREKGQEMQNMLVLTTSMRSKEGLFVRTFDVAKKFELSQATISVKREIVNLQSNQTSRGTQSGQVGSEGSAGAFAGVSSEGTVGETSGPAFVPRGTQQSGTPGEASAASAGGAQPAGATALAGEVNEVVQLGRPRFLLSGGMVYSPLPRRTFRSVKGFLLDAQGNPTGKGDANVVGFKQNSPRRLFPMLFLNSRVLDYQRGSLYFSFGITGKKDDNFDLEYLVGPSVSFLNDRALFTFGAYGGLTQNLVDGVSIGDEIPDSVGDAKFFRKKLTWKPGFSFSYSFSSTKKRPVVPASSGGTASSANDLRNEIRIGSIPFNLALGLAVTSLDQRTYDPIAGFARDRQGNLTNGETLTRIVGVTSSSNYRLSPMAMLHSRLTNFGSHDFYFTSGITGKKTNDDFDLEYLLGGSVNIYQRKVFLTFGTFIGKQQVLGANFFEGQSLGRGQGVTTEDRYVWKPAISFSYDISRIISRPNQ